MSDDLTQADPSAEIAQSAVEPNAPAPWGDDFNPERAWQTISHLRGREKELESKAKQYERLAEDEDALKEFLAERGYAVNDDEELDDEDAFTEDPEDPTADLRRQLSELESWRAQQEAERGLQQFNKDLDGFAAEAKVELTQEDRDLILNRTVAAGGDKKAAEKAFNAHVEYLKAREKAIIDRYVASKTEGVPTPPQAGKAGRAEFDPNDRKARRARMEAIVAGNQ